ncbi:hypothetical protein FKP32DRAFT_387111 [Trametes sanguinea]|nr:hypothetical protein FKP32DRAFT_387111 [Trametes sanguinea]
MIVVASRAFAPSALRSVRVAGSARRFIQTGATGSANAAEAYLEPVQGRPGITALLLNRPKAKNAISMRLLKEFQECLDRVQFDKECASPLFPPPPPPPPVPILTNRPTRATARAS